MPRTLAIGDIHGCSKTFRKLVDDLHLDTSDKIICIGDYIDRGPDSKGVIDFILELRETGYRVITLRGNHEQMLLEAVRDKDRLGPWIMNGGDSTLESFGIRDLQELEPRYLQFFRQTRFFYQNDQFIFVHAGMNFTLDDPFEDREAMLWIRHFEVDLKKSGNRSIIHGHTPRPLPVILRPRQPYAINLDAGCVMKHRDGLGHLVALDLSSREFLAIPNCE